MVSYPTLARWRTRALEVSAGAGKNSRPVFLLLHGFGDHAGTWSPVLADLAVAGCHAVALDLPGYGEAEPADSGPSLPQLDSFVNAAVEHWTIDGVAPIVVGNSLGGVLAIRAGQDPNSGVSGVVPVSPAGYGHAWFVDLMERFHQLNPLLFVPVVPMSVFRRLTAASFAWAAAGGGARVLPGIARAAAAQFRTRADVKRVLGSAPDLLQEIRAVVGTPITVPCLIIWGGHDRLTLVSGAAVLQELAPNAELVVLEDCGHCSQVTRPDLVAAHLVRFAHSLVSSVA
ncbi:MAG: alpha/beta hydrolase fold protein [Marmoricola sp.]|nr:alpha/beta hydrolase fold protein [Marmoricola sp.]